MMRDIGAFSIVVGVVVVIVVIWVFWEFGDLRGKEGCRERKFLFEGRGWGWGLM